MTETNVYTVPDNSALEYYNPTSAPGYTVPPPGGPFALPGYAAKLNVSPVSTPDALRLGVIPPVQDGPAGGTVPDEYYAQKYARNIARDRTGQFQGTPWQEQWAPSPTFAPNPRATPPPEQRYTSHLSPRTWAYYRPAPRIHGGAKRFTGVHFSMADHRRNYPIGGMIAQTRHRNTYRAEPGPWDANIVDMPADPNTGHPYAVYQEPMDVPHTRTYRLDE